MLTMQIDGPDGETSTGGISHVQSKEIKKLHNSGVNVDIKSPLTCCSFFNHPTFHHSSKLPPITKAIFISSNNTLIAIMSPGKTDVHPTYRIASIPADGIGPEVIEAGITVLKRLASTLGTFSLEFEHFDWSSDLYKKTGKYLPDDALTILRKFDAILFGAVGAPGKRFPS